MQYKSNQRELVQVEVFRFFNDIVRKSMNNYWCWVYNLDDNLGYFIIYQYV